MPTFAYKGKGPTGEPRAGTLLAENKRSALKTLEEMDVFPLEVEEKETEASAAGPVRIFGRVKDAEVTDFLRQLADLLAVGVPFDRAMEILVREGRRPAYLRLVAEIRSTVASGTSFSQSIAKHPRLFPELYVSMVAAGEEGGFLPDCLSRIAELREKRKELRSRVQAALVYPLVLALFGTATVAYLMVFFIPRFTTVFRDMGGTLPAATRFLVATSEFAAAWWPYVLGTAVFLGVLLQRWLATPAGARARDRFLLALPYLRDVVTHLSLARFARTLGTLLASGVPILKSLEISKGAAGNRIFQEEIAAATDRVREGKGLALGLAGASRVPGIVKEKIAVGEETGKLPEVLVTVSDQYERALDRSVKLFVAVFEPALIFLMAGAVGFIVISMLLPIFTLNSMIR